MAITERRFSTGLPFLDRRLDGGIAVGEMLALTAPPASQSELFLRTFLRTTKTAYISTTRTESQVRRWAEYRTHEEISLSVAKVDTDELTAVFEQIRELLDPESILVIDTVNGLERTPRSEYVEFLNALKRLLRERDCIAVLHCPEESTDLPRRGLTLSRADQVWQLEVSARSREIKNRLLVTKSRNGRALSEPVDVVLTDTVRIDTSRRIT